MANEAPATRPANPRFSSGPCAKPPTFTLDALKDAALGRSHRAAIGKDKLKSAIETTREILGVPAVYVPANRTELGDNFVHPANDSAYDAESGWRGIVAQVCGSSLEAHIWYLLYQRPLTTECYWLLRKAVSI